jgi:hypothetical protein
MRSNVTGAIMRTTKYFVCNENTLCYQMEGDPMLGVLGGKPQSGGRSNSPLEEPFFASPLDKLRPATVKDFEFFRVSPRGHLT